MKLIVMLLLQLLFSERAGAFKANLDYCKVKEKREFDFLGFHGELESSYCCKHCCDKSVTSPKKCT